jgi:galactokinase
MYSETAKEQGLFELADNAKNNFKRIYQEDPSNYYQCRIRAEYLGNFTDHGGKNFNALGGSANLGIIAAISSRPDREIHLWTSIYPNQEPESIDLDDLPQVSDTSHWYNHQISILSQIKEQYPSIYQYLDGANFAFANNVPPGISMGTSTAAEASFLTGILGINGVTLDHRQLIAIERQAELNIFPGCGWLDHVSCLTPVEPGHGIRLNFNDSGDSIPYTTTPVCVDVDRYGFQWIAAFAEKFRRNIPDTGYTQKVNKIKVGARLLKNLPGQEIYNISQEEAIKLLSDDTEMAGVVSHIISENRRVLQATELFGQLFKTTPDTPESRTIIANIGQILNECGQSSITHMGVSTGIIGQQSFQPFLDIMHEEGAIGARNMGGGFTPTMLALVEETKADDFIAEVSEQFSLLCSTPKIRITRIYPGSAAGIIIL